MSWIQTLDGAAFDLLDPKSDLIEPHVIGVCLARTCRFKGHCNDFYSVAQHSVIVSQLVIGGGAMPLAALLHDAHEVYTGFGDIARPAKYLNNDVRRFLKAHEQLIDVQIAKRFGFDSALFRSDLISLADAVALSTERRDIMGPCDREWDELPPPSPIISIEPLGIDDAYRLFMSRLYELLAEYNARKAQA